MIVDRKWVERISASIRSRAPAASTFAFAPARNRGDAEDFQREIIDFDSEGRPAEFLAFTTATGLSRFTDVPWPKGLAPKTGPRARAAQARCRGRMCCS